MIKVWFIQVIIHQLIGLIPTEELCQLRNNDLIAQVSKHKIKDIHIRSIFSPSQRHFIAFQTHKNYKNERKEHFNQMVHITNVPIVDRIAQSENIWF